jgi:orotate phosphoribosyltransferase
MSKTASELLSGLFFNYVPTKDEIIECLKASDVLWQYNAQPCPNRPHALLTSGKHSDGFANVGEVLKKNSNFCRLVANAFFSELEARQYFDYKWVVGADTSSTDLAHVFANSTGAGWLRMIKHEDEYGKKQLWNRRNPFIADFDTILQVEDLITTSSSALQVRKGIRNEHPRYNLIFAPFILTVVDRSDPDNPVEEIENSKVISLVRLEIRNFAPDNCPYCAEGSVAIPPKKDNNWAILTGKSSSGK